MEKLGGKLSLPSLPEVVMHMQELLRDPDCGMKDLGKVLQDDPPLAARVLRIANSAFYSLRVPILDISHGAAILGLDTLQTVVMQVAVVDLFSHIDGHPTFDPRRLWRHAVLTARMAASFPPRLFREVTKDEVYVCGLLHDIGKFVMFDNMRVEFARASLTATVGHQPLHRVERETFGFTHADVGALVAERWGLPSTAVKAIGGHHNERVADADNDLVVLIAAANHIANQMLDAKHPRMESKLPSAIVDRLKLDEDELEALVEMAFEIRNED